MATILGLRSTLAAGFVNMAIFACGSEIIEQPAGPGGVGAAGGSGGGAPCPDEFAMCDAGCVDTEVDPDHCGACGIACGADETCDDGVCEPLDCPPGLVACGGTCVDPKIHPLHCGASGDCTGASAGEACEPGFVCDGEGACALSCQVGLVDCDGVCVDPLTDEEHCGAGADCRAEPGDACTPGELCDGEGGCALSCQVGFVDCNGDCTDPLTDEDHCGAGVDCEAEPGVACEAGELCDGGGKCALTCQDELLECGGVCTDPLSNPLHCGGCDNPCPPAINADAYCNAGTCDYLCDPGFVDCNGEASDGCEAHLDDDALHCGGCGTACSTGSCVQGWCDKFVFVTSSLYGADFGGLLAGDAICQAHADAAGLGGTYMAWLSTNFSTPANRFVHHSGRYVLVDGTPIADSWSDLTDASIDNPLVVTELGTGVSPDSPCDGPGVWTGTGSSGASGPGSECASWTQTTGVLSVTYGDLGALDGQWTNGCFQNQAGACTHLLPLYCFEQ